jgi:hypothetical protein
MHRVHVETRSAQVRTHYTKIQAPHYQHCTEIPWLHLHGRAPQGYGLDVEISSRKAELALASVSKPCPYAHFWRFERSKQAKRARIMIRTERNEILLLPRLRS